LSAYLGFGVVIWAIIVILLTLDPRFNEKIEAVQRFISGIPGIPKKKED
jgi:hypothetical protein